MFAYEPTAPFGSSGHENYIHRPAQGSLRLDNPREYVTWYYGTTPEAAIGESFADHVQWSDDMFETPWLPSGRRVLGIFEIADTTALLELDDAKTLFDRSLRPTQVVGRVRAVTQAWALNIFREKDHSGDRIWRGVRWWSFHRPHWGIFGIWTVDPELPVHKLVEVQALSRTHPAVVSATTTLNKMWR